MAVTVLVVDDMPEVRTLLNTALGYDGRFEVIDLCGTAEDAVQAAARGRPDVIVLDVDLPDRDGLSTIPDLRQAAPDVSIVVFSGSAPLGLSSGVSLGAADAVVRKTDGLDALVETMVRLTGADDSP